MKTRDVRQDGAKEKAANHTVIFLDGWRKCMRKKRYYRIGLNLALGLCCAGLFGYGYYLIDQDIPSVIHVRAGEEQSFDLNVPAKGEIASVGSLGESNIPKDKITIDLSEPVTLKTSGLEKYSMEVKLFGFLPFKEVGIEVVEDCELIPVGQPVGIYMEADGVLVVGVGEFKGQDGQDRAPARNILQSGDYVRKLNGASVTDKEMFINGIEESDGMAQVITVERQGELIDLQVKPVQDATGAYKIGVWVRDSTQGVGTMTYVDSQGNFGALGHGINDIDTSALLKLEDGTIYSTQILSIKKGSAGKAGEMTGMIVYTDENILGDISYNGAEGIFGCCNEKAMEMAVQEALPVGFKQEIKKGKAQILCTVEDVPRYYEIEITDINLDHDNINRGIELTVTDPELLSITGGIVQGMSGSPIIQDGKIIGAVTHVLVNDPTRGYGIFIENMLDAKE